MWPTNTVLMIRPAAFGFNEQTAASNAFQQREKKRGEYIKKLILEEFDELQRTLENAGVKVLCFPDLPEPPKPDAIFPNNWFSTHPDGQLFTYPMAVSNRAAERRADILEYLQQQYGYVLNDSMLRYEKQGKYLEGTGSLIIDHQHRVAFAAESPRTHMDILTAWEKNSGHKTVRFRALGPTGEAIYHTNVMLTLGDNFAVLCADAIIDGDRKRVLDTLQDLGKEIILLSKEQTYRRFAGNMLQLCGTDGKRILVMSQAAHKSLTEKQRKQFAALDLHLISADLALIERIGGGSARCMLAEIITP